MWWFKKKGKSDEASEELTLQERVGGPCKPSGAEAKEKDTKKITVKPEVVGKGVLLEWLKSKLEENEFQEAARYLDMLTLQFQVGGTTFHISKSGVDLFTLKEGRAISYDALIIIPAELEEILASSDSITSFLEKYKEHLKKPPRIRVQLIKSLEELERKGVMRSKVVRGLLGI
ncbi:MAG: hypothetical protein KIH01_06485 [Candidatus Freyarchaeota archaeon]|nr:hypothetical protein [Candidatus Jordarchaeia archaeon]